MVESIGEASSCISGLAMRSRSQGFTPGVLQPEAMTAAASNGNAIRMLTAISLSARVRKRGESFLNARRDRCRGNDARF